MAMNWRSNAFADKRAKVVFPTPGGPHKIMECGLPEAKVRLSGLPSASKCDWPMTSAIVLGRNASAKGGGGLLANRPFINDLCLHKNDNNSYP